MGRPASAPGRSDLPLMPEPNSPGPQGPCQVQAAEADTRAAAQHAGRPPLTLMIDSPNGRAGLQVCGSLLAEIDYGPEHRQYPSHPQRLLVGLEVLSQPPVREVWRAPGPVVCGWQDGIGYAQSSGLLFAHLALDEVWSADPAERVYRAYGLLLNFIRSRGCPHPLRVWNVLSHIHTEVGSLDGYQAFCVGRERALQQAGIAPAAFPAATAVGAQSPGLLIYLFAADAPGIPVENPRQVSAYRYPPRYGPTPPSFARALRYHTAGGSLLFISGTASVVAHRSLHPGQLGAQLRETLANLDALLIQAPAGQPNFLKVFLRDPRRLTEARAALGHWATPSVPILYLRADVCRRELEVEIEGVCSR